MHYAQFRCLLFYFPIAIYLNNSIDFQFLPCYNIKMNSTFLLFFFLVSLFEDPGIVWSTMPGFLIYKRC